ncbi:hypothetical protein [Streptomyces sp. MH60]|uniref:hypothetical protein n=1 Tax=Streptomyces sp. MH60 TaxID=1940758 RepID=UPI000D4DE470|nr:hypothetical protein [Streptomyces sp. MH60]PPS89575.1 hypothetical protein BZZ08_01722 [Streptomyces sp. MH60]
MPTLDTLKPGDRFSCPMCHRHVTVYTEGTHRGGLRPHKAGHAGRENVGGACPGAGFSPFRPAFPQYVRLYGLAEAIEDVRRVHGKPDWTPEPREPGELQDFVWAVWPQADRFEMAPPTGVRGVTFTIGPRRWYFAAPDSYLSKQFASRADAGDALYKYLREMET